MLASLLPYFTFITLFSFQGAALQLLLKPDLKIQIPLGFEIQQQITVFVFRPQTKYDYTPRFALRIIFGGPEWARTTDLTIISRTL